MTTSSRTSRAVKLRACAASGSAEGRGQGIWQARTACLPPRLLVGRGKGPVFITERRAPGSRLGRQSGPLHPPISCDALTRWQARSPSRSLTGPNFSRRPLSAAFRWHPMGRDSAARAMLPPAGAARSIPSAWRPHRRASRSRTSALNRSSGPLRSAGSLARTAAPDELLLLLRRQPGELRGHGVEYGRLGGLGRSGAGGRSGGRYGDG